MELQSYEHECVALQRASTRVMYVKTVMFVSVLLCMHVKNKGKSSWKTGGRRRNLSQEGEGSQTSFGYVMQGYWYRLIIRGWNEGVPVRHRRCIADLQLCVPQNVASSRIVAVSAVTM